MSDDPSKDPKNSSKHKGGADGNAGRRKFAPKVIITFAVVLIILAIVMALNPSLLDWYNPLFNG